MPKIGTENRPLCTISHNLCAPLSLADRPRDQWIKQGDAGVDMLEGLLLYGFSHLVNRPPNFSPAEPVTPRLYLHCGGGRLGGAK